MVAKAEMDSVKVVLGEQSLRERERDKRINELEKRQRIWDDFLDVPEFKEEFLRVLKKIEKKEKGN